VKAYILVEYRAEIGVFLLLVLGLASFLGILGVATGNHITGDLSIFQDIITALGGWTYWITFIGVVGFLIVLWWVIDYILKVRKLKDLIDTESKAKFIKNMDEIDFIAWRLPKKFKTLVSEKKVELKIA
jgi:hypothetical protein